MPLQCSGTSASSSFESFGAIYAEEQGSNRCKLPSFTHLENAILELKPYHTCSLKQAIDVTNIHRSISTPCLPLANGGEDESDTVPRIEIVSGRGTPQVRALAAEVAISMASGVCPTPISNGLGGVYLINNRNGDKIAVAKPADEEPLAFNNPKGYVGQMLGQFGLKRSVRLGETGIRELAAYLLDHDGFAGVPATALVKLCHAAFHVSDASPKISAPPYKIASLQRFVNHDFDAGELGPSGFSVASVHRIGILDVRLFNLDRHAGNILVKKLGNQNHAAAVGDLVPIDHGLCLPECLDDPYFEWLHWPQASVPLSEAEIEYISCLDPLKDAELLRNQLPSLRESSIRVMILCTILLKRAASVGLLLTDIGTMMTREFSGGEEYLSTLENICAEAKAGQSIKFFDSDDRSVESDYMYRSQGWHIDEEEDVEMFQFDDETNDGSIIVSEPPKPLQNLDEIVTAKSIKVPILTTTVSLCELRSALQDNCTEIIYYDPSKGKECDRGEAEGLANNKVGGGLTRSKSVAVPNHLNESGGISFEEMNEAEWQLFLESFEKLLPEVLESTKSMGLKQRLGSSCKF